MKKRRKRKIVWLDTPLQLQTIKMAELIYGYKDVVEKDLTDDLETDLKIVAISKKNLIVNSWGPPGNR